MHFQRTITEKSVPKDDVLVVRQVVITDLAIVERRIHFAANRSRQLAERADQTHAPFAGGHDEITGVCLSDKRVATLPSRKTTAIINHNWLFTDYIVNAHALVNYELCIIMYEITVAYNR